MPPLSRATEARAATHGRATTVKTAATTSLTAHPPELSTLQVRLIIPFFLTLPMYYLLPHYSLNRWPQCHGHIFRLVAPLTPLALSDFHQLRSSPLFHSKIASSSYRQCPAWNTLFLCSQSPSCASPCKISALKLSVRSLRIRRAIRLEALSINKPMIA